METSWSSATVTFPLPAWPGVSFVPTDTECLKFFPLDQFVERPVAVMAVVHGDDTKPVIWEKYRGILKAADAKFEDFELVERFSFYERARQAYAVLATGESALYANVILKKGVVVD